MADSHPGILLWALVSAERVITRAKPLYKTGAASDAAMIAYRSDLYKNPQRNLAAVSVRQRMALGVTPLDSCRMEPGKNRV
jgi:hypothetical protein